MVTVVVQGEPVVAVQFFTLDMFGRVFRRALSTRTPWAFQSDTTLARTTTLTTRCQKEALSHARGNRRLIPMLRLVREMKAEGVKPDLVVYNALLACIAQEALPLEAWAVVDDMTATGIPLDRQSYHHLLHVSSTLSDHPIPDPFQASRWSSTDAMWQVVHEMKKQGIEPDEHTYALIIGRATATESLELALQYMHEMDGLGLVPRLTTAQDVIKLATDMDLPKLAIEIAQNFESRSPRKLGGETWMSCLTSSADMLYVRRGQSFRTPPADTLPLGRGRQVLLAQGRAYVEPHSRRRGLSIRPPHVRSSWSVRSGVGCHAGASRDGRGSLVRTPFRAPGRSSLQRWQAQGSLAHPGRDA